MATGSAIHTTLWINGIDEFPTNNTAGDFNSYKKNHKLINTINILSLLTFSVANLIILVVYYGGISIRNKKSIYKIIAVALLGIILIQNYSNLGW